MNAILPIGWRGRPLALMLLFVAVAIAYLLVLAPLLDLYSEQQRRIASERMLLTKLNAVAAQLPALHARVAKLRSAVDVHKLTFEGASDAIASAALQGHIEQYAATAGVTVGSTEIIPAQTQGDYHRIGLRLLISGSYQSLLRLLAKAETATPPLIVDNLQIRGLQRRLGVQSGLVLDASIEVSGFRAIKIAAAKP